VMTMFYTGLPQKPIVNLTPAGIQIAYLTEYFMYDVVRCTMVCLLILSPSIVIFKVRGKVDVRSKVAFVVLFMAFILPIISTKAPVDQPRWFFMLLTILTPYIIVGLYDLDRKAALVFTMAIIVSGVAYTFTDAGYTLFRIWPSGYAGGYPWRMGPTTTNLADIESISRIINERRDVVLTSLPLYPQIHLYVRNPENIIIYGRMDLPHLIYFLNATKLKKVLVVTEMNLTSQFIEFREKPEDYNMIMEFLMRYSGKESWIKIDDVICREIYVGSKVNLYELQILVRDM